MFRAIRFNERLKDLNKQTVQPESLKELAAFFSGKTSYNNVYSRSKKYFYYDLPQNIKTRLENAHPWEILYLDETWDEVIGERFEGLDITAGISFNYHKYNYPFTLPDQELFLSGIYLEQRFYHNINSFYQIGTNFYSSYSKAINKNTTYDFFGNGRLQIENLWNLTDKMLAEFGFGLESTFVSANKWERIDNYFADIQFQYFIENNMSANFRISYDLYYNWPGDISFTYNHQGYYNYQYEKEKYWHFQLNLMYFLERGLL